MNRFHINKRVNPTGLKKDEYDVIIIGAGIGGLTCGCYLAKAGMKVLIVEKNYKPGGYCMSFKRKGFVFDTGIHALEGLGENGFLTKIFSDLSLQDKLDIKRNDYSDIIITNGKRIKLKNSFEEILIEFQRHFPGEKDRIETFFNYIFKESFASLYADLQNKTFSAVLDRFMPHKELRSIICVLLRNIGLPSNKVAAINAVLFFRSYLLKGGYYPIGGMGTLSNALCNRFKEYGGDVFFSQEVKKVVINNNKVEGILVADGNFLKTDKVISNCDATHTYFNLIGENYLNKSFIDKFKKMVPTVSTFLVFLGIKMKLNTILEEASAFWLLDNIDAEDKLSDLINGHAKWDESCIMISSPSLSDSKLAPDGKESIFIICNASFQDVIFWKTNRNELCTRIINKAEHIIPELSMHIEVVETATPQTFFSHTYNREGAIHGWAALVQQIDRKIVSEKSELEGLFLTGHWITQPGQGGLPTAMLSGVNVAEMIIDKK